MHIVKVLLKRRRGINKREHPTALRTWCSYLPNAKTFTQQRRTFASSLLSLSFVITFWFNFNVDTIWTEGKGKGKGSLRASTFVMKPRLYYYIDINITLVNSQGHCFHKSLFLSRHLSNRFNGNDNPNSTPQHNYDRCLLITLRV